MLPALFQKEWFNNPFPVNHFRTLLQNTQGVPLKSNLYPRLFPRFASNPITIRTYAKHTRNPFRIRTSKAQDLKSFRIRTYEKTGGRVLHGKGASAVSRRLPRASSATHYSLLTAHSLLRNPQDLMLFLLASCPPTLAAPSTRPSPSLPGTAKSTTHATAASCGDRAMTPETLHARQATRPSAPAPCLSSASISPVGTQSFSAPCPLPRPKSDPAAQSAFSTGPASSRFLSRSYRNSSPASLARSTFPSCAAALATRATHLPPSSHSAAASFSAFASRIVYPARGRITVMRPSNFL